MTDKLLTVEEAAGRLGTSVRFVRRLIAERRIAYIKVGRHVRIAEADLASFVAAGRIKASARWPVVRGAAGSGPSAGCRPGATAPPMAAMSPPRRRSRPRPTPAGICPRSRRTCFGVSGPHRWGSSGWLTEHHASTRGRARARLASSCDLGGCAVGTIQVRSLDQQDETRSFPNGVVEMVTIADTMVGRARFQPGWRWSSDAKPT